MKKSLQLDNKGNPYLSLYADTYRPPAEDELLQWKDEWFVFSGRWRDIGIRYRCHHDKPAQVVEKEESYQQLKEMNLINHIPIRLKLRYPDWWINLKCALDIYGQTFYKNGRQIPNKDIYK